MDSKSIKTEELNKDNFRWRISDDEEVTLNEMNVDFKLTALAHSLKHANKNFAQANKFQDLRDRHHNSTKYFMKLVEILEDSLLEDHGLQVPSDVNDIRAMKRMIKEGIIKVSNYDAKSKKDDRDTESNIQQEEE